MTQATSRGMLSGCGVGLMSSTSGLESIIPVSTSTSPAGWSIVQTNTGQRSPSTRSSAPRCARITVPTVPTGPVTCPQTGIPCTIGGVGVRAGLEPRRESEDDLAVPVRSPGEVRAIVATAVGLLLLSLVALASGGSPWHAGGRQDVPVGVVRALAAVAGALVVGSVLLVWAGTPSVKKRRRRRRRLGAKDLEGLGASMSAAGKAAAIVGGAIGLFLLLALPFLAPTATTPGGGTPGNAAPRAQASTPAPAGHPTSAALTWLVVGSAAALLLV